MNIRTTARDEAAGQIDDILAGRSGQGQQLSEKHNQLLFESERHTTGCGSGRKIGGWKDQKNQYHLKIEASICNQGSGIRARSAIQSLEIQDLDSEPGIPAWNQSLDFGLEFRTWVWDLDLGLAADDHKPRIIPLLLVIAGDDQKFAPFECFPRMLEGLHQFGFLCVVDAMKSNFQMAVGCSL